MQAQRIGWMSVLSAALALAMPAAAQVGGGLRISTPGSGVEFGEPGAERFGVRRLGSESSDNESLRYDGRSRFSTGFLLADWHPYASGFRLSGGLLYGDRVGGTQPGQTIGTDGMRSAARLGDLDGRALFSRASPYLGVGWGLAPRGASLYFTADLGVTYQRPSAGLTASCGPMLPASVCTQLQGDTRADELEFRDTDELRLYPVISVGFGLRF